MNGDFVSKKRKYCMVPGCARSSIKFPTMRFISVPKNETRRKAWLKAVRTTSTYSKVSNMFVCEEHFDLKEDAENYMKLRFYPGQSIVIKEGVVPHIFKCQPDRTDEETMDEGSIEERIISDDQQTASTDNVDIGPYLHVEMREKTLKEEKISDNEEGALDEENVPLIQPMCVLVEGNMDEKSIKKEIICDDQELACSVEVDLGEERISDEKEEKETVNVPGAIRNNHPLDKHKSNTDFGSTSPMFESVFLVMPKVEVEDNEDNENGSTASDSRSGQSSKNVDSVEASNPTPGVNFRQENEGSPLLPTGQESFACPQCEKTFPTASTLCRHMYDIHYNNETDRNSNDMQCESAKKHFVCPVCEKVFSAPSHLKIHLRTHTGERPYSCPECAKSFALSGTLKLHIRTHTGEKPYVCSECNRGFCTPRALKGHMATHTGEKPFVCPECDKRFALSDSLKMHMQTHTGEKLHVCSECNRGLSSAAALRSHMATHTGEKPFVCPACNKGFPRVSQLNVHIRTAHLGEKRFECPQCGKRVFNKTDLRSHIRTHTGEKPFVCPYCDGCFSAANSLKKHIRLHTEEKRPYVFLEDLKKEDSRLVT